MCSAYWDLRETLGPGQRWRFSPFIYLFPRTVSNTSWALLKVSVLEFFIWSTTSCGALLFWTSDMTSSLLAGKFKFGRYCWSCPRSRLRRSPRSPKLPRPMFAFLPSRFLSTSGPFYPLCPLPNQRFHRPRRPFALARPRIRMVDLRVIWLRRGLLARAGASLRRSPRRG